MECADECDICDAAICGDCSFGVDTCSCCRMHLGPVNRGTLCGVCILVDWFGPASKGFKCERCLEVCKGDKCNLLSILDSQRTCPICLDDMKDSYELQVCELHKVCLACDYDKMLGCPICRDGR